MKVKKIKNRDIIKKVIFAFVFMAIGWWLHGRMMPDFSAMMRGAGDPYVVVAGLEEKDVSPKKKYIAQAQAINSVDIVPQVSGYLQEVLFEDGSFVNEGDKIFVIEQRQYQADLKSAEARVTQLRKDYERMSKLHRSGDIADKQLDVALSNLHQAEAALDVAKLNLEHSEITSPISGKIGKALVTKGNFVNPSTQKLARIVQMDPIRIAFSVTDKERARFLAKTSDSAEVFLDIVLPDGSVKSLSTDKIFIDNEVNTNTATMTAYVELENADKQLVPGNYVDIYLRFSAGTKSLLVPQVALSADVNGTYVMTVNQDNVAEQKYITVGQVFADKQVVLSGLDLSDRVIIQGLQKVKNGAKVNVSTVSK